MEAEIPLIRLWGIERYEESLDFGKVVCPIIFLWESPASVHVVAVAEHDTLADVQASIVFNGTKFYKVRPHHAEWVGWQRRLRAWIQKVEPSGWVAESLVFERRA